MPEDKIPPLEAVTQLKSMGYSNYQIIDIMQAQGYKANEIYQALNQYENMHEPPTPPAPSSSQPPEEYENPVTSSSEAASYSEIDERIQEIAEEIIAEKWEEILGHIKKVVEWKRRADERIKNIEADIEALKEQIESVQQSIINKLKDYDSHLTQFSANFQAMESVFKDVLPQFTQSVQDLAEYIDELRGKKRSKEKRNKEEKKYESKQQSPAQKAQKGDYLEFQ